MENVGQQLKTKLENVIKNLYGVQNNKIVLDLPDLEHGDFTTNAALMICKDVGKSPREIAEQIKTEFENSKLEFVGKIEVAGPGFINFWIDPKELIKEVQSLSNLKNPAANGLTSLQELRGVKETIIVEFTDPNPFKEFHIGHLYSNTIGESLCRLLESQGNDVWRVTYQGDVGLHVAKSLWGMIEKGKELGKKDKALIDYLEKMSLDARVNFMGQAYALGSQSYENPEIKELINQINKQIYEMLSVLNDSLQAAPINNEALAELYKKGRAWTLEYFDTIYARLGSKFKKNYFESVAGPIGLELVKKNTKEGVFIESDGAIIFPGEKYGLHNRVFINSLGLPTYEAKDMALPSIKYKDVAYDKSIIITAHEQSGYFKVVLKALSMIEPKLAVKTSHIGHGMVRLPEGKMSSRTGGVITAEWLLSQVEEKVKNIMSGEKLKTEEKLAVIDQIVVGAVKYSLLKSGIGQDIKFDLEASVSLEGDSGPYLQYTYARTQSILEKSKVDKEDSQRENFDPNSHHLEKEELQLLQMLNRYKFVVQVSADKFAPNLLASYLFELAKLYNLFYQKHPIIKSEPRQQMVRLLITKATGEVLKNGLYLLGIKAPEKM